MSNTRTSVDSKRIHHTLVNIDRLSWFITGGQTDHNNIFRYRLFNFFHSLEVRN